eukprot:TRINITY_DN7968_c0_g1_i1.p1 TRINITY_DN7968_c0_g1~~TRINITY_DN7968_c0_g1_i1.p1  ORF type:complete len:302 (-),score=52.44 TRINITY_DN7968_c0_g1_i1:20-925(-)
MNSNSQTMKIFLSDEIRRMTIPLPYPNWHSLLNQLSSLFSIDLQGQYQVYYYDDEKDRVLINSQLEWEAAMSILTTQPIPKLYIEPTTNSFQNKAETEKQDPSTKNREEKVSHDQPKTCRFGGQCPRRNRNMGSWGHPFFDQILSGGFPTHHNRPQHFPWKLEMECPFKFNRDWKKICNPNMRAQGKQRWFGKILHKKALRELEEKNYRDAHKILETLINLNPSDSIALYNMACCEALTGATESALTHLVLAVENGYSDVDHIQNDPDLESIRGLHQYWEIISGLEEKISSCAEKIKIPIN